MIFYTVNLDMTGRFPIWKLIWTVRAIMKSGRPFRNSYPYSIITISAKAAREQEGQAVGFAEPSGRVGVDVIQWCRGASNAGGIPCGRGSLSVPDLDDGMAELAGGGLEGRRSLLVSEISQAFEETRGRPRPGPSGDSAFRMGFTEYRRFLPESAPGQRSFQRPFPREAWNDPSGLRNGHGRSPG